MANGKTCSPYFSPWQLLSGLHLPILLYFYLFVTLNLDCVSLLVCCNVCLSGVELLQMFFQCSSPANGWLDWFLTILNHTHKTLFASTELLFSVWRVKLKWNKAVTAFFLCVCIVWWRWTCKINSTGFQLGPLILEIWVRIREPAELLPEYVAWFSYHYVQLLYLLSLIWPSWLVMSSVSLH